MGELPLDWVPDDRLLGGAVKWEVPRLVAECGLCKRAADKKKLLGSGGSYIENSGDDATT